MLTSPYNDFGRNAIIVAMPYQHTTFSKKYIYPDNSTVRTGADFWAAHYLAEALNFNIQ